MAVTDIGAALLRTIDPETAHGLAIRALQLAPLPPARADDPILATTVAGLHLPNPVGLAAGLDKHGHALHGLFPVSYTNLTLPTNREVVVLVGPVPFT